MDTLTKICADKRDHIAKCKRELSEADLIEAIAQQPPTRGFEIALTTKQLSQETALITEIKKASPSAGIIRKNFDPVAIAQAYSRAGATCLSMLTDQPYFQGEDRYINDVKQKVEMPILRKDFILDTYQVLESRALGADCILLIMAALEDTQAKELEFAAIELGLDVLIEVHDFEELERAVTHLSSPLIGINNRNLKTLEVDLNTSKTLSAFLPEHCTRICESGIRTHQDILDMQAHSFYGFLVGESLMRQADIKQATLSLLSG
jgi:indole-3-glycerol phosphate synthase